MFVSNLPMSKTRFMLLCGELGPFIRRSDTTERGGEFGLSVFRCSVSTVKNPVALAYLYPIAIDCNR